MHFLALGPSHQHTSLQHKLVCIINSQHLLPFPLLPYQHVAQVALQFPDLFDEVAILQRLAYKNNNQHRASKHHQAVCQVRWWAYQQAHHLPATSLAATKLNRHAWQWRWHHTARKIPHCSTLIMQRQQQQQQLLHHDCHVTPCACALCLSCCSCRC